MVRPEEENKEETVEFIWGSKKGRTNKDSQLYGSYRFDGVEYFLGDCVYLWDAAAPEPHIGKLVQIWETQAREKKVKVVWFFRPIEVQHWLGDVEPLANEIFLASGEGEGLTNINPLESISGKCNVICTSNDKRNAKASAEELRRADGIFYRTFDVGTYAISDKFPDVIAGHDVKHFFNQKKDLKISDRPVAQASTAEVGDSGRSTKPIQKQESKIVAPGSSKRSRFSDEGTTARPKTSGDKDGIETVRNSSQLVSAKANSSTDLSQPLKKRKHESTSVESKDDPTRRLDHRRQLLDSKGEDKRAATYGNFAQKANKVSDKETGQCDKGGKPESRIVDVTRRLDVVKDKSVLHFAQKANKISDKEMGQRDKGGKAESRIVEVTTRPDAGRSRWFKQQAWDERMQRAHENGSLVLLENLDPSYTSSDVEDIIWQALEMKVSAKMVQRSTFSSPHCGQAYVIFRTKDAAESALSELYKKCLMLSGGSPVVARLGTLKEPSSSLPSKFPGHLVIDKLRLKRQREEMRNAVSTAHCSQPNNVEYDMAIEWRALQQKSRLWWDALHKQQAKEIEDLRVRLKIQLNA